MENHNWAAGCHKVVKKFGWVNILDKGCHKVNTRYHIRVAGYHKVVKKVGYWSSLDGRYHKINSEYHNQAS